MPVGVLCALCCACTPTAPEGVTLQGTGPVAPTFDPVVIPNPNAAEQERLDERRPLPRDESGFREKWELASQYVASGFDDAALQIIDAALAQNPPEPWGERLEGLETTLRSRRVQQRLVRIEVRPLRDYVLFQRGVKVEIRIQNVSDQLLSLLPPQSDAVSPSAITLELTRLDRDVSASARRRAWTQTLYVRNPAGGPVEIQPGTAYTQQAVIPPSDIGGAIQGFRVLEIGGRFRSTRLKSGDAVRPIHVPLRAGRVVVVPRGYEPVASDPLGSMRKAVDNVAPVHLLLASEFVSRSDRAAAVERLADVLAHGHPSLERSAISALQVLRERSVGEPITEAARPLMDALERTTTRSDAVMDGLSAYTGVNVAPDVRLWRDFWRRAAAARTPIRAATVPTATG